MADYNLAGVLPKELYTRLISLFTRLDNPTTALELFSNCREYASFPLYIDAFGITLLTCTLLQIPSRCPHLTVRRVHKGADVAAWQLALLLLARDRAEQTNLLKEMDKRGMAASEPVYEAVVAGHLYAADMTAANEALVAGRREGFKLNNAHSAWIAQQIALDADQAVRQQFFCLLYCYLLFLVFVLPANCMFPQFPALAETSVV